MILLSGGFDPLHCGHLDLIEEAQVLLGPIHVLVMSDQWVRAKKGFTFQPEQERARIVSAVQGVTAAEIFHPSDAKGTVAEAIYRLRPEVFLNGGDRTTPRDLPREEIQAAEEVGCTLLFCRGGKSASSSRIPGKAVVGKPWGWYEVVADVPRTEGWPAMRIKRLHVNPGGSTHYQRHSGRDEYIVDLDHEKVRHFAAGVPHQIKNASAQPRRLVEVQVGEPDESDVEYLDSLHDAPPPVTDAPTGRKVSLGATVDLTPGRTSAGLSWATYADLRDRVLAQIAQDDSRGRVKSVLSLSSEANEPHHIHTLAQELGWSGYTCGVYQIAPDTIEMHVEWGTG